jgi:hypothetical protein
VLGKLQVAFGDELDEGVQGFINLAQVRALDDRDNTEMVLFTHPDDLGLVSTHPHATAMGPVGGHARGGEVVVCCDVVVEEVVFSQLISLFVRDKVFVARCQTIVFPRNIKLIKDLNHGFLKLDPFLFGHGWWEIPAFDIPGHSGSDGDLGKFGVDFSE